MPIQESKLVAALEPFHGFVLANVIYGLQQSGLEPCFDRGTTVDRLARERGLDPRRLAALVDYLVAAGLLHRDETGVVTRTAYARSFDEARPWYEMMVGGYGVTFRALGEHLAAGSAPTPRVGGLVSSGSCGMSRHDSIPLLRRLLAGSKRRYTRLVDLGCGSGVYLTELCRDYPELTAVGIEPDENGAKAAREWVAGHGDPERIRIEQTDALTWLDTTSERPDLAVLGFVIHEVLGQEGEDGVRRLLGTLFSTSPDLDLAVIDIDLQSADADRMQHPLARNYYNAYFLMHPFTSQRLESGSWWESLFADCGLRIVASGRTDPAMDSTGFEIGWLLRRADR
jgi:2-ketoarginine methyltransferase